MRRKPDGLVILALVFGLGVVVSTLTHGSNSQNMDDVAATAGVPAHHLR